MDILALFNERPHLVTNTRPAPDMPLLATVTRESLRQFLEDRGTLLRNADRNAEAENNKLRQTIHRMLISLKNKGVIGCNKSLVWLIDGERYDD
jgi:fructose-1-phosphate kinase PfkB-like protein